MPGRRRTDVNLGLTLDADFDQGRKSIARDLDKIERDAKDAADEIEDAFKKLSPELDTSEIRKALELAGQLDGMVAEFTVDTDLSEIQQAEAIARSLRGFQGRVDLSVEGREELRDALGLAESMEQLRRVKVEVQGREDLERAGRLAEDLEQRRTVHLDVDVDDGGISRLGEELDAELSSGAARGAAGIESELGGLDLSNMQGQIQDGITGALASAGAVGAAAALLGELVGEDLAAGIQDGFNRKAQEIITGAKFGLDDAEMVEIGRASGDAWGRGFGESQAAIRETGAILQAELADIDRDLDLGTAIPAAETLAKIWGVEIPDSARLARNMVSQGLAPDTITAYRMMADAARTYQGDQDEVFGTFDELTSQFARMGIDGARGFTMLGDAAKSGQIEVGQMAELFEEFTGQITDGSAQEAIEAIGLNWEETQARFANGEGAEVMADVNEKLLTMKDRAAANAIAADLYGESWAKVADPEVVLGILAQADAQGVVTDALADGQQAVEESTAEWEKAKRTLESLAGFASNQWATAFNELAGGVEQLTDGFGLWGDASDNVQGKLEGLANLAGFVGAGPIGLFADNIGNAAAGLLGLDDGATKATHKIEKAGEQGGIAGRKFSTMGEEATDGADGIDELKAAAEELDAALQAFSGRFDADSVMRSIEEDAAAATEATKGLTSGSYDLGTGFDITTEKGRAAEAAMEGLSGNLDDLIQGAREGTVTSEELASGQARVEAAVRAVAAEMKLTEAETEDLVREYASVPSDVTTNLNAIDNATRVVQNLQAALAGLKDKTITVTTRNAVIAATAATAGKRHGGGPVDAGKTYIVGGPGAEELFTPDVDGQISDPADTRRILAGSAAAQSFISSAAVPRGGGAVRGVLEIGSDGSDHGQYLMDQLRKAVRNRGGNLDIVFRPPRR